MAVNVEAKITELFSAPNLAGYYNTKQEPERPYIGATLFPNTQVVGRELKYVLGRAGVPVALRASALDANAPFRDRIPMYMVKNEMPFFRESSQLNEEMMMDLMPALQVSENYARPIIDKIFDDRYNFILSAEVSAERLRMYLLAHGEIDIIDTNDNVPIKAEYGFDAATQMTTLAGTDAWDQTATSQPMLDIEAAMEAVGLDSAIGIMTQATYNRMKQSESLRNSMFGGNTAPQIVTPGQVDDYLSTNYKFTPLIITPRNNQYRLAWEAVGTKRQFFPDGVVTLIPAGATLGETVRGSTPEGLTAGMSGAQTEIVNSGVAIRTYYTPHTVNHSTIVSQTVLPSFPAIENMFIINAY